MSGEAFDYGDVLGLLKVFANAEHAVTVGVFRWVEHPPRGDTVGVLRLRDGEVVYERLRSVAEATACLQGRDHVGGK